MTTPEPTAEHIDAVAREPQPRTWPDPLTPFRHNEAIARIANRLRTTTDPDAQAALAANLPREVMLAALVADSWLCSQCGERPSAMVKIGTADGWCTTCLDGAAELPPRAVMLAALVADGTLTECENTALPGWRFYQGEVRP